MLQFFFFCQRFSRMSNQEKLKKLLIHHFDLEGWIYANNAERIYDKLIKSTFSASKSNIRKE